MMKGFPFFFVKSVVLVAVLSLGSWSSAQKTAPPAKDPETTVEVPDVMAEVNGEKIMKTDLSAQCLRMYGLEEIKDLVKKFLIQQECANRKITVTQQEIDAEIVRMAKTFNFSSEEWLALLQKERGISAEQYMQDIIWPILAIGKLGGDQLAVTEEEIAREYEARFGEAVQVRQIMLKSKADAEKVYAEVKANPEAFASIAKNHSQDPASQPYGGLVHPIRHHMVEPAIEQAVFALQPEQISPIVEQSGLYFIFRCEQKLAPQNVDKVKVRNQLVMKIRDLKTRSVSEDVFGALQSRAKIEIVFGNPARMAQMPDVAAIVNGQAVKQSYLADLCMKRHGKDVLSDMISRKMIEQTCAKQGLVITEADIDNEIREMAIKHLPLKEDGQPNVEGMMKLASTQARTTPEVYRINTVWPALALKKLSRPLVQITEEDIQKGFEANFGKKVRCLAIAFELKDQRRALEAWEKANRNKTAENFGDLAELYSVDPESRMNRGVIPPIARYCGQPALEQEAFGLLPNEISQIVQVDGNLVILYCLGHDEPTVTNINDVRQDLIADIFDKKQKMAVARCYEAMFNQAAFDNYLTGESRNPEVEKEIQKAPQQATSPNRDPIR